MPEESIAHVSEPWELGQTEDDYYDPELPILYRVSIQSDTEPGEVAAVYHHDLARAEATAKRIIAAINAVAGIPTSRLEELAKNGRLRQVYEYEQSDPVRPDLPDDPALALGYGGSPKGWPL